MEVGYPTPNYNHLWRKEYKGVYEPSEDTFLLLDCLEKDANYLKMLEPTICLEIGFCDFAFK